MRKQASKMHDMLPAAAGDFEHSPRTRQNIAQHLRNGIAIAQRRGRMPPRILPVFINDPRRWSSHARCSCSKACYRSEEHTSELQSLMRISYAVFCLKKKNKHKRHNKNTYKN